MSLCSRLHAVAEHWNEWRRLARETAFEKGYRERVQRGRAALVPLSQIGKGTADAFVDSVRPGTLTVTVGDDTVTLDPLSSTVKFGRDLDKIDELLGRMAKAAS